MSTLLAGSEDELFAALQSALRTATAAGEVVMVVTLSNACPSRSHLEMSTLPPTSQSPAESPGQSPE